LRSEKQSAEMFREWFCQRGDRRYTVQSMCDGEVTLSGRGRYAKRREVGRYAMLQAAPHAPPEGQVCETRE